MGQRYKAIPIKREQRTVLKTQLGIVKVKAETV
jgi:hypothetical protein